MKSKSGYRLATTEEREALPTTCYVVRERDDVVVACPNPRDGESLTCSHHASFDSDAASTTGDGAPSSEGDAANGGDEKTETKVEKTKRKTRPPMTREVLDTRLAESEAALKVAQAQGDKLAERRAKKQRRRYARKLAKLRT